MKPTLRDFIRANRAELDKVIRRSGYLGTINDNDREEWILNDGGLYLWARSTCREGAI